MTAITETRLRGSLPLKDSVTGLAPAPYESATLHRRGRISRQDLAEHRDALMGIAWGSSSLLITPEPGSARPQARVADVASVLVIQAVGVVCYDEAPGVVVLGEGVVPGVGSIAPFIACTSDNCRAGLRFPFRSALADVRLAFGRL